MVANAYSSITWAIETGRLCPVECQSALPREYQNIQIYRDNLSQQIKTKSKKMNKQIRRSRIAVHHP